MKLNFIPRPYKKVLVTLRMECEKLEHLDKLALIYQINRSQLINRCIDYALAELDGISAR